MYKSSRERLEKIHQQLEDMKPTTNEFVAAPAGHHIGTTQWDLVKELNRTIYKAAQLVEDILLLDK